MAEPRIALVELSALEIEAVLSQWALEEYPAGPEYDRLHPAQVSGERRLLEAKEALGDG